MINMAIAFFIFCIFPSFRLSPSKLLWYIFMVSGSLRSFQGFLLSLNMAIIVILQSTSDYSIFDVFVSQFVFVVSAVSFFHVFYIFLQASYVWLCAVNCIWKIICRNSLWQRHRISSSSENFCCVVQGFLDSQSKVQGHRYMLFCFWFMLALRLKPCRVSEYWALGLELWLLYSFFP